KRAELRGDVLRGLLLLHRQFGRGVQLLVRRHQRRHLAIDELIDFFDRCLRGQTRGQEQHSGEFHAAHYRSSSPAAAAARISSGSGTFFVSVMMAKTTTAMTTVATSTSA